MTDEKNTDAQPNHDANAAVPPIEEAPEVPVHLADQAAAGAEPATASDIAGHEGGAVPGAPMSATNPYVPMQPAGLVAPSPYTQPAPYGQQGVQPTPYQYGAPMGAEPKRGLSVTSLVLGIVSLVAMLMYLGWLVGVPAVIFGHIGLKKEPAGRGMAIAGLIMGYAAIALSIIFFILAILLVGAFFVTWAGVSTL